jgi:hypothetical protein
MENYFLKTNVTPDNLRQVGSKDNSSLPGVDFGCCTID